jgi:hypothetical protein
MKTLIALALMVTATPAFALVDDECKIRAWWENGLLHVEPAMCDSGGICPFKPYTCEIVKWPRNSPDAVLACGKKKRNVMAHMPDTNTLVFDGIPFHEEQEGCD